MGDRNGMGGGGYGGRASPGANLAGRRNTSGVRRDPGAVAARSADAGFGMGGKGAGDAGSGNSMLQTTARRKRRGLFQAAVANEPKPATVSAGPGSPILG